MFRIFLMEAPFGDVLAIEIDSEADPKYESHVSPPGWVPFEDAEGLQMRVIELEQQLKTQDELKAELEADYRDTYCRGSV